MYDFEHNGIYITPTGYFKSVYNSVTRKQEAYSLSEDEITVNLNSKVYFDDHIRLKHIVEPLINQPIYHTLFKSYYWSDLVDEIKTTPWQAWIGDCQLKKDIDSDKIEYITISKRLTVSEQEQTISDEFWDFFGKSYPCISQTTMQRQGRKLGESIDINIGFLSFPELMNTPFKTGETVLMINDDNNTKPNKIITIPNDNITLYQLINSIFRRMSSHGNKEKRTSAINAWVNMCKERQFQYQKNKTNPQVFVPQNINQLISDLKKQTDQYEFEKIMKKITYFFDAVEDKECLDNFKKTLIQHITPP